MSSCQASKGIPLINTQEASSGNAAEGHFLLVCCEDMEFRTLLWGTLARCCSSEPCAEAQPLFERNANPAQLSLLALRILRTWSQRKIESAAEMRSSKEEGSPMGHLHPAVPAGRRAVWFRGVPPRVLGCRGTQHWRGTACEQRPLPSVPASLPNAVIFSWEAEAEAPPEKWSQEQRRQAPCFHQC